LFFFFSKLIVLVNIQPLIGNIEPLTGNIEPLKGNIEPLTGMFCNQALTKGINKSKLDTPAVKQQ